MDLNYVLLNVNTAALVEVSGRHTMEMLTSPQQRLPELRIVTRCPGSAAELAPLQTSSCPAKPHPDDSSRGWHPDI